jgi:hypothetical protein
LEYLAVARPSRANVGFTESDGAPQKIRGGNLTDPLGLWYALIPGTWFDGNGFEGSGAEFFRAKDFEEGAYADWTD